MFCLNVSRPHRWGIVATVILSKMGDIRRPGQRHWMQWCHLAPLVCAEICPIYPICPFQEPRNSLFLQNVSASCFVSKMINPKDEHGLFKTTKKPFSHSTKGSDGSVCLYYWICGPLHSHCGSITPWSSCKFHLFVFVLYPHRGHSYSPYHFDRPSGQDPWSVIEWAI